MITILRRNQRVLMLCIAILTIIAFAWLYNPATTQKLGANTIARIYGQGLSQADIDREARNFRLSLVMGQYSLISALGGMDSNEDHAAANFIWNLFVLHHEAAQLGINPTDDQIADLLKKLPIFQTDGHFDIAKYNKFVAEQLGPAGFTEAQLNSVATDALVLERVKSVISAPVTVGEAELNEALRTFQKVDLQVVHFPVDKQKTVAVSEDEVRAFFEKKKAEFVTPETRSVEYVEFNLPPAVAAQGKERVEALQKLADESDALLQKTVAGTSFEDAAKAAGLTVQQTPDFDREGKTSDLAKDKAEDIKKLSGSSFLLTEGASDIVEGGNKYFVVKLVKITPERQLSLDEARPFLQASLQEEKAAREAQTQAEATLTKLRNAVQEGHTLADAAKANGLTVDLLSGIDLANLQPNDPKVSMELVRLSTLMEPAQLSGLLGSPQGPVALYLAARAPLTLSPEELAKQKSALTQEITEGKRRLLFSTWLASANEAAGIAVVPRGDR